MDENSLKGYQPWSYLATDSLSPWNIRIDFILIPATD